MAEGIQDGSIRPIDPKIASFAAAGALSWIARWYDPEGALSPEELANVFIDLLMRGIAS
jgi:hypothetical protein